MNVVQSFIKFGVFILFLVICFSSSGCATMRGFGQDVQAAGMAIEDTF